MAWRVGNERVCEVSVGNLCVATLPLCMSLSPVCKQPCSDVAFARQPRRCGAITVLCLCMQACMHRLRAVRPFCLRRTRAFLSPPAACTQAGVLVPGMLLDDVVSPGPLQALSGRTWPCTCVLSLCSFFFPVNHFCSKPPGLRSPAAAVSAGRTWCETRNLTGYGPSLATPLSVKSCVRAAVKSSALCGWLCRRHVCCRRRASRAVRAAECRKPLCRGVRSCAAVRSEPLSSVRV